MTKMTQMAVKEKHPILHFDRLESTNLYLQRKIQNGEDVTNEIVTTDFQTGGRGLDKNKWESEEGQNLLFSMALNVSFLEADKQFKLSQAVPLGILTILKKYLSKSSLSVKWPNDIYYSDKKLGGILINNNIVGSVMDISIIGIGLNVNQIKFGSDLPNPISLKTITNTHFDRETLLNELVDAIIQSVSELKTIEGQRNIEELYISNLYRYGKKARYEWQGKEHTMMITGFDKYGHLQLQDEDEKMISCDLKEIRFLL